jgi:hypothetical protein
VGERVEEGGRPWRQPLELGRGGGEAGAAIGGALGRGSRLW